MTLIEDAPSGENHTYGDISGGDTSRGVVIGAGRGGQNAVCVNRTEVGPAWDPPGSPVHTDNSGIYVEDLTGSRTLCVVSV